MTLLDQRMLSDKARKCARAYRAAASSALVRECSPFLLIASAVVYAETLAGLASGTYGWRAS
jgi:hypothetical protein